MKKKTFHFSVILLALLTGYSFPDVSAQNVGINTTGATPNASAMLDLNTGNTFGSGTSKGLLIPNVALTSATDVTTINLPAYSLMVYNTGTPGLTTGYYYNANPAPGSATWTQFGTGGGGSGWALTGNTGTTPGTNFVGTIDSKELQFKVNNQQAGWIDYLSTSANLFLGYQAGANNTDASQNTALGYQALYTQSYNGGAAWASNNTAVGYKSQYFNQPTSTSNGDYNTSVGEYTLYNNTTGNVNTAIGATALFSNSTGYENTAVGLEALYLETTGNDNTAVGNAALYGTTSGAFNTAMGYNSLFTNITAVDNTASGAFALYRNAAGSGNTALGFEAGVNCTASKNVFIGDSAGMGAIGSTTGIGGTFVGYGAGATNTTGNQNTMVGYMANVSSSGLSNATAIGNGATAPGSNSVTLGNAAATSLYLPGYATVGAVFYTSAVTGLVSAIAPGTAGQVLQTNGAGAAPSWANAGGGGSGWALTGNAGTTAGTNFMGTTDDIDVVFKRKGVQAGWLNNVLFNTSWGVGSMSSAATGNYNSAFGKFALADNTSGSINTAVGSDALFSNTTGYDNTATGMETLFTENSGNDNTGDGYAAMYSTTTGSYNTSTGGNSLFNNVSGSKNTADGWEALYNSTGSFNTAVGWSALATTSGGSNNTAIGYDADVSSAGLSNATVIGSGATAIANNSVTLGSATATNLYLPGYSTVGSVFYTSAASGLVVALAPGTAGQVLQTNGAGAAPSWANAGGGGSGWALTGNAGTTPGTNFVGTTDDEALEFKTNGTVSGLIQPDVADGTVDLGSGAGNVGGGGTEGVFIGYNAGTANKGSQNTAIGYKAAFLGTTGVDNISMGYDALYKNVSSNANVSIGVSALYNATSGYNTALGYNASYGTSTGQNNTGIGANTLNNNLCGCTGGGTGSDNTALGAYAGLSEGTGSNNTYIGYYANCNASGYTNATAIGAYAEVTQSNSLILGGINGINGATASTNVGIGTTTPGGLLELGLDQGRKPSTNTWTITSDERLKNIEGSYNKGLKEILLLQPIVYHYKNVGSRKFTPEVLNTQNVGFSAQQVQKIFPEAVGTDKDGYLNFNIHPILIAYVNAIKELSAKNDSLKADLEKNKTEQAAQIDMLNQQMTELKKLVYSLTEKAEVHSAKIEQ